MQNSKNRNGSSEKPQKSSPVKPHKLKVPASESESVPSPNRASRTPKNKSPKVVERRPPHSPSAENKRSSKVSELESQLSQLQDELKKTKDQLATKRDHEEAKNELAATSADPNPCQLSDTNRAHKDAQNELAATSAEPDAHQLSGTLSLVEKLKSQLSECEKSEAQALDLLTDAQVKLELAKTIQQNLISEKLECEEAYKSVAFELQKLKNQPEAQKEGSDEIMAYKSELFEVKAEVEKLKSALLSADEAYKSVAFELEKLTKRAEAENDGSNNLEAELFEAKNEVEKLKSALILAEKTCHEENIQNTLLIRSAHEQAEQAKAELAIREVEMGAELEKSRAEIEALKAEIKAHKENKKDNEIENENKALKAEIRAHEENKNKKDTEFENENEALKAEIRAYKENKKDTELENERKEGEWKREKEEAAALVESARASEREALMKIGYLTEEVDKSDRRVARVVEELAAVEGSKAEMEAEMRRLKVQSDQWRKAAEAAAAMISSGNINNNNGKFVERTGSLGKGGYNNNGNNNNTIGSKLGSPFSGELYDESPKKKNGNMLRKLGVLLKKGQK